MSSIYLHAEREMISLIHEKTINNIINWINYINKFDLNINR